WAYDGDGNPRDLDGPTLLHAVQRLTDALGGIDYYWSPNASTALLAKRHCRTLPDSFSHAIRNGDVTPAINHSRMVPAKWARPLTDAERADTAVIRLDRNAAYLSAMKTPLGYGEPTWFDRAIPFDRKLAGYWRITAPPDDLDPMLPELKFKPDRDGAYWL